MLASAFCARVDSFRKRWREILLAIAGPATIFAMFLMFELARMRHGIKVDDGHPYSSIRIGLLFFICDFYKQQEHCWLARRATELAYACCERSIQTKSLSSKNWKRLKQIS
jgi:hypothetical protein